jgi:hypothetical protein
MTANNVQSGNAQRRVSFADEIEADRSDSTQESRLSVVTTLATAINTIETTSAAALKISTDTRRTSLTAAIRRTSTHLEDGLCESQKELKLLGILPEPESSEDEDSSAPVNTPSSEEGGGFVVPYTIPEGSELDDGGVSPKDMVRSRYKL